MRWEQGAEEPLCSTETGQRTTINARNFDESFAARKVASIVNIIAIQLISHSAFSHILCFPRKSLT